jgi:hypothetical protein
MLPLSTYLRPATAPLSPGVEPAADAPPSARDAAEWFAQGLGEHSQVLRAPAAPATHAQAAELSQRFLACLCDT